MSDSLPTAFPLGPAILFCPADRPERFAKAAARADAVILDLEDAVAPESKPQARAAVADHLGSQACDPARTVVRINPPETAFFDDDVAALRGSGVQWVMLAKTESVGYVEAVAQALPEAGLIALCETAAGIVAAESLAAHPRVAALMWGAEDLIASLGGTSSRDGTGRYRPVVEQAKARVLLAAGAHGKGAIDAIVADFSDEQGLTREAQEAVACGWDAKACIHPRQAPVISQAYAPTQEQLEHAQALLEQARTSGGVFSFRGAMVDGPLIRHAEQIVRRSRTPEA